MDQSASLATKIIAFRVVAPGSCLYSGFCSKSSPVLLPRAEASWPWIPRDSITGRAKTSRPQFTYAMHLPKDLLGLIG